MKKLLVACLVVGSMTACGKEKEMATTATAAAEKAISGVREEAAKFAPEQLKAVEDAMTAAKESFTKEDYKAAMTAAQDVTTKATELGKIAMAKKSEMTKTWAEFEATMPKMVETMKTQVDAWAAAKKLPANITKEKLAEAQTAMTTTTAAWTEATTKFKNGQMSEAIAQAKSIKDGTMKMMSDLGISEMTAQK